MASLAELANQYAPFLGPDHLLPPGTEVYLNQEGVTGLTQRRRIYPRLLPGLPFFIQRVHPEDSAYDLITHLGKSGIPFMVDENMDYWEPRIELPKDINQ